MKILIIDIDGTVCEDIRNEEGEERMKNAKMLQSSIDEINKLYDQGHFICFFTARTDEFKQVTEEWLEKHGVRFHKVIYNKPRKIGEFNEYHFIDDSHVRATTFKGKFTEFVKKNVDIEVFDEENF
jgi:uncharacterized HAD superfamily protein